MDSDAVGAEAAQGDLTQPKAGQHGTGEVAVLPHMAAKYPMHFS